MQKVCFRLFFMGMLLSQCGPKPIDFEVQEAAPNAAEQVQAKLTKLADISTASGNLRYAIEDSENAEAQALAQRIREHYAAESFVPEGSVLRKAKYVQFENIRHWSPLGNEYAAGYDERGKLLAIYDLTYQSTSSEEFLHRSVLGTIGIGSMSFRELLRLIREAIEHREALLHDANDTVIHSSWSHEDLSRMHQWLDHIESQYGDTTSSLQGDWWTKVPLQKAFQTKNGAQVFRLSDVDWEHTMSRYHLRKFRHKLRELEKQISELLEMDASHIFERLAFRRNAQGSFELIQLPTANLSPNARPSKVIDFVRYQSSFAYQTLYALMKESLASLSNVVPNPVLSALIRYAIYRWFALYEAQLSFHRFRAFELLSQGERGEASSFSLLTADERMRGGVYVLSHESSLLYNIFKPKRETYYYQTLKAELANIEHNTRWAQQNNFSLNPLSKLYFQASDAKSQNYLLLMGARPRFVQRPLLAIQYQKPSAERTRRNILYSLNDLLACLSFPLPGIGYLASLVFDVFVMDDVRNAQKWDARLVSYLRKLGDHDFSRELEILYAQRVNPFEWDIDEERAFIAHSRNHLGF